MKKRIRALCQRAAETIGVRTRYGRATEKIGDLNTMSESRRKDRESEHDVGEPLKKIGGPDMMSESRKKYRGFEHDAEEKPKRK